MTLQSVFDEIRQRPGAGDVITIINPVTEEQIAEFTDCGEEAVNEAVARAKAAFEAGVWSELPGRARAKIMWRIADLIDEHAAELAQLPLSALLLNRLIVEAGVPDGVVNLLTGYGHTRVRRSPRTPTSKRSPSPGQPRSARKSCGRRRAT
jgi:acyl-CoA reductase-like NAD-dependent aldehyde dehydrogenase